MKGTRTRHALTITAAVGLLVTLSGGTAAADTKTKYDPVGDAVASADLTRATIGNRSKRVVVTLRVRGLRRHSDATMKVNHPGPGHFVVRTAAAPPTRARLSFARGDQEERRRCRGLRAIRTFSRDRIRIRIPQRCFGAHAGGARFSITTFQHGGSNFDRLRPVWVRRN